MAAEQLMLENHPWLTPLRQSRDHILRAAETGKLALDSVTHLANTEALLALALIPVPADPVLHIRTAHAQARNYLGSLADAELPNAVPTAMGYTMTPRKALRRVLDHLLDHLNQIEQWVLWQRDGSIPVPTDGWVGSSVTLDDDRPPLSSQELAAWLWRIDLSVQLLAQRVSALDLEQLDWQPPNAGWTLRKILHHVASGAILYTIWFGTALPEAPLDRYRGASDQVLTNLIQLITTPVQSHMILFEDDLDVFSPDQLVSHIVELERSVLTAKA